MNDEKFEAEEKKLKEVLGEGFQVECVSITEYGEERYLHFRVIKTESGR